MRKLLFFLTVFLKISDSFSQDTLRYVDFHIHTSLKNYYRDIPVPDSIREEHFIKCHDISNWSGTKHRSRFLSKTGFCGFYGSKSYPEASWNMLNAGKLK